MPIDRTPKLEIELRISEEQLADCKAAGAQDIAYLLTEEIKKIFPDSRITNLIFGNGSYAIKAIEPEER